MRLAFTLLLVASAACAAVEPARLLDDVEARAIELALKLSLDLGRREAPSAAAPNEIVYETQLVPELLAALCDTLAANPALDFGRGQVMFSRAEKVLHAVDGKGADHPLHGGTLRLIVPVAASGPAAKRRAATIRAVRALTTSNDARFLSGELCQLRDLRIERSEPGGPETRSQLKLPVSSK